MVHLFHLTASSPTPPYLTTWHHLTLSHLLLALLILSPLTYSPIHAFPRPSFSSIPSSLYLGNPLASAPSPLSSHSLSYHSLPLPPLLTPCRLPMQVTGSPLAPLQSGCRCSSPSPGALPSVAATAAWHSLAPRLAGNQSGLRTIRRDF